jgi:hypothetical protein
MTLKAIAYKSGYTDSNVATATYAINIPSDDTPPTGSIIINGGDLYTSSTSVTLTLTYSDDGSGVKDVRYGNSGDPSWSDWEAPSPTKSWILRSEDGSKVVVYQIRDYDYNTATYYGHITYDATPPGAFTVSSSTHPDQDVGYSSNDPSFTWTIPTDSSGIAGYSIGISPYSFAIPNQIIDTTDNTFSYTDVEDGQWYFIVRAVDNAGNWGYIANYRFKIDTTSEMETLDFDVSFEDEVYVVETCSNSSVTDLVFSQPAKRLMFTVEGSDGTVGVCDITFPADLLSGAFTVYMDDTQLLEGVDYTGSYNATHHTISINYEHSSHVIEVFGTHVIPDFTAWLFISFLMLATLVGFALKSRLKKHPNPNLT